MPETQDTFGGRLVKAMEARSMSVRDLDKATDIPARTIAWWKSDQLPDAFDRLHAICKTLNVSADWLIGLVESAEPIPLRWDGEERRATGSGADAAPPPTQLDPADMAPPPPTRREGRRDSA